MTGLSRIEQEIYDKAGGGEEGRMAVENRRKYMRMYKAMEREYAKERRRRRYYPRNEKTTATLDMLEDVYDD